MKIYRPHNSNGEHWMEMWKRYDEFWIWINRIWNEFHNNAWLNCIKYRYIACLNNNKNYATPMEIFFNLSAPHIHKCILEYKPTSGLVEYVKLIVIDTTPLNYNLESCSSKAKQYEITWIEFIGSANIFIALLFLCGEFSWSMHSWSKSNTAFNVIYFDYLHSSW